ncbi:MAG: hypothetical protein CMA67_04620 [Euryarchaeota archaeon]|nr:hypothetical protein [Euryarchaeota archaeon]
MKKGRYAIGWDVMSASESRPDNSLDVARKKRANADGLTLAALRSQFTSAPNVSTDQALLTSARFREEERMRADIRRERRLRQQAISERVSAMQDAIANDLAVQHELTLDALEKEMRSEMEVELAEMERSALASEETRMREQLDLRMSREISNLQNQLEHEHNRRLEEHKEAIKQSIEVQLQDEHRRRLELQKERLSLEYNQRLQQKIRELEADIEKEMESRFVEMENKEIETLEEGHNARLAEREEQLRRGIRTRLEQQLRNRLNHREARLRAEYDRRSLRLEEDIAQQLQQELEAQLRQETADLEERMREDVELAIARRRDELRVEIQKQIESSHSERLSERKGRLKEKYDITFSKAVDDISKVLKTELDQELARRSDEEFISYRNAREAEIQNRLARFRFERETELRGQLEEQYEAKRTDWAERLEIEFQSRETAARKAIMAELDAQLRNERLTFETDLDLLKEETALELEVDMEERLAAFRVRKQEEIAVQLERQLDKREEIMRNKALIDVRKREASIRAEIEAQLGLKRAEVRDRLNSLAEKMDSFREMAETKMRDAITSQIQGEIDSSESELRSREQEFAELQQTDTRAEKRQKWMQSISGQAPASMPLGQDPSTLGARSPAMSGMTRALGSAETQTMGLGGMRAPIGGAKPLGQAPTLRPVKAPIGGMQPGAGLPKPIERQVRMPVQPTQELPAEEIVVPVGAVEVSIKPGDDGKFGTSDDEARISKRDLTEGSEVEESTETTTMRPVQGTLTPLNVVPKETEDAGSETGTAMLRPVQQLKPIPNQPKVVKTSTITPVRPQMIPKKQRGPPPTSTKGEKPSSDES